MAADADDLTDRPDRVLRDLSLLLSAARVSPILRDAVLRVEAEVTRLRGIEPPVAVTKLRATIALLGDLAGRSMRDELGTEDLCREREERIELLHLLGYALSDDDMEDTDA